MGRCINGRTQTTKESLSVRIERNFILRQSTLEEILVSDCSASVDCSVMSHVSYTDKSIRMGKSSLGKRKTSVPPVRVSSLGSVGELPEPGNTQR